MAQVEDILELVRQLSIEDRALILEEIASSLRKDLNNEDAGQPLDDLYGLVADLGAAPSEEDIAEVRREMMRNFPREDVV